MDTAGDQPTSYISVDVGDPEATPLANLIREQLQGLHPISSDHVCIYRVPLDFRQVNEKAFTPQMVSVGPFHHGKPELRPWEEHKLHYLQAFLNRSDKSLEDYIEFVKRLEGRARACYRERIDMTSNAFVNMMLADGCFVIEAIWRLRNSFGETNDYLDNPELICLVARDMILLENQIPFFVLRDLFQFGFNKPGEEGKDEFLGLSITYFSWIVSTMTRPEDIESMFRNVKGHLELGSKMEHFTDLLRICHLPTNLKNNETSTSSSRFVRIPNATSLHEAGMKFKTGTSKCLLDIKYNNGLLEMPKFFVHDFSECMFKNIVALETCHYPFQSYITGYISFMDMFIDTATDVDLLIRKGIIINKSDSDTVASVFNNAGKEASYFSESYFRSISEDMNAYYKVPWHKWKATFKRDYCSTPWMIASTVAAIILLVLTLIQTIFSII